MMRISMPLAGMDPTRKVDGDGRDHVAERAFRMLSEGELFYVETDLHEDAHNANRHDHGHLGGVSLEVITESMASREPGLSYKPESCTETEATSRSSSQDSGHSDNAWEPNPMGTHVGRAEVSAPDPFPPRISLKEACQWDFLRLEDAGMERRSRERSFSEPQLHRCLNNEQLQQQRVPQIQRLEWFTPPGHHQRDELHLGTVTEGTAYSAAWGAGGGARRRNSLPPGQDQCRTGNASEGDMCARTAISLERAWAFVFGGGAFKDHGRVEGVCRHLASCTSTKTFAVSSSESDRDALARLGVVPDTDHGLGGPASMTFTMHIAGHRVVSTLLGMHAEYEVRLKGGGRRWSRWQRFSKFKMIASCVGDDEPALKAWNRVLQAKPHYRCLNPAYLAQKCNLLEVFLQQVMFAMPTPALLIHFVSHK